MGCASSTTSTAPEVPARRATQETTSQQQRHTNSKRIANVAVAPFHPDPDLRSPLEAQPRDALAAAVVDADATPVGPTPAALGASPWTPFAANPFDTPGDFLPDDIARAHGAHGGGDDGASHDGAMLPAAARTIGVADTTTSAQAHATAAPHDGGPCGEIVDEPDAGLGDVEKDSRPPTPAITLYEFCTEMHLRRIEGRGNMARKHGYTADPDQFPAPPHPLTEEQQRSLQRRCLAWRNATTLRESWAQPPRHR